jgi:hypothetical protein
MAFLPDAAPLGQLQRLVKDGACLLVDDQLSPELLQCALGERTCLHFDAQRHFPPQVIVGALFGFVVRDPVVGLQHQRGRQQAGRHARAAIVAAIQGDEVLIPKQLVTLRSQKSVKGPLTHEVRQQGVCFKQPALR